MTALATPLLLCTSRRELLQSVASLTSKVLQDALDHLEAIAEGDERATEAAKPITLELLYNAQSHVQEWSGSDQCFRAARQYITLCQDAAKVTAANRDLPKPKLYGGPPFESYFISLVLGRQDDPVARWEELRAKAVAQSLAFVGLVGTEHEFKERPPSHFGKESCTIVLGTDKSDVHLTQTDRGTIESDGCWVIVEEFPKPLSSHPLQHIGTDCGWELI